MCMLVAHVWAVLGMAGSGGGMVLSVVGAPRARGAWEEQMVRRRMMSGAKRMATLQVGILPLCTFGA